MKARTLLTALALGVAGCGGFEIRGAGGAATTGAAGCHDGVRDGDETDVDCGGSTCAPCAGGRACHGSTDCAGGACHGGKCQSPTCTDQIRDGDETDVDCGGECPPCAAGLGCEAPAHCDSGVCEHGTCLPPTCEDRVKNGGEADADCGGSCRGCGFGKRCAADVDCAAGSCEAGICTPKPVRIWELRPTATGPAARYLAGLAYDAAKKKTILHGGYVPSPVPTVLGDQWEWDGTTWTVDPTPPILPRHGHQIVYESARGAIFFFGGALNGGAPLGDTAEWDGTWHPFAAAPAPVAQYLHGLAYDRLRDRTVMFAGTAHDGTWEWDGIAWSSKTGLLSAPSARFGHRMVYDSRRGVTVLFGGTVDQLVGHANQETWEWDGKAWTLAAPAASPSPRFGQAMTFDSDRGVTLLVGGASSVEEPFLEDTWEYDGATWVSLGSGPPGPGYWNEMTYDEGRKRAVLVRYDAAQAIVQTWESHVLALPCHLDAECGSGHCIDGLCCATACGECQACDTPGSPGRCAPVTSGLDPDSCAGTCDSPGTCVPKGP